MHFKHFKWMIQKHVSALVIVTAGVETMDGF